jgi:putative protease
LAPAGSFLKLKMAIKYGADAVYLAGSQFGLRTASKNFDNKEIKKAIEYTHKMGKKVYITINVIPHNQDIKKLPAYLKMLNKLKPDALIISDLGVMSFAKRFAPDIDIHISTQANNVKLCKCKPVA